MERKPASASGIGESAERNREDSELIARHERFPAGASKTVENPEHPPHPGGGSDSMLLKEASSPAFRHFDRREKSMCGADSNGFLASLEMTVHAEVAL